MILLNKEYFFIKCSTFNTIILKKLFFTTIYTDTLLL